MSRCFGISVVEIGCCSNSNFQFCIVSHTQKAKDEIAIDDIGKYCEKSDGTLRVH